MAIDYNLCYEKFHYQERYQEDKTKLLLGGSYVPLRAQFQNVEPSRRETVRNVLLVCGGSGYFGFLAKIVRMICEVELYKRYHFAVICGLLNSDFGVLKEYEKRYPEIEILQNVKDIVNVLQKADIVVSSAGTVLYECCCVGVLTIFLQV